MEGSLGQGGNWGSGVSWGNSPQFLLFPTPKVTGPEGIPFWVGSEGHEEWVLGMKLSPGRPEIVSCLPQQKAKDNRAAHRINKVQKVSGGWAGLGGAIHVL